MPYYISAGIDESYPGLWGEASSYEKRNLYSIREGSLPPVNYDVHTIYSHSVTHIESPKHTIRDGKPLDSYFANPCSFFGKCRVVKIKGNKYTKRIDRGVESFHWEVSLKELMVALNGAEPQKILLTSDNYPEDTHGRHDPRYVMTLSVEAARYLTSIKGFDLYGTTWKSSDYEPNSSARPIHNILFESALIMECLVLNHVPEGDYFLSAFPLNIIGASESPVSATLFSENEISNCF